MSKLLTHLRNASRACTQGYEVPLSIKEVGEVVALVEQYESELQAKELENERLRDALKPFAHEADHWDSSTFPESHIPACDAQGSACGECGHDPDYASAMFTLGDLRRARLALVPLSPPAEVDRFIQAMSEAPAPQIPCEKGC